MTHIIVITIDLTHTVIEVYLIYAASALSFNAFMRYVIAGGMTIVGIPWYRSLGVHYTLT